MWIVAARRDRRRARASAPTLVPRRCPRRASSSRRSADGPAQRVRRDAAPDRASPKVTDASIPKEKRPKPERLHGRHVLNRYEDGMEKCIGCELCAGVCPAKCIYVRGADNPIDDAGVAGRALRLRLRDQLPALHPLRPVRRGVPDRGDHRDEAVRVLVHQPRRRDLHQGRAARRRRRPRPGASRGSCGSAARTTTRARGCARPRRPGRPRTRAASAGRASSASACGRRSGQSATEPRRAHEPRRRSRDATSTSRRTAATDVDSGHLLRLRARSTLAGAFGVVLARNPVHSALFLVADARRASRCCSCSRTPQLVAAMQIVVYAERDRRAVPVRDHAARRRPARVAATTRCRSSAAPRSCSALVLLAEVLVPRRPPLGHRRQAPGARDAIRGGTRARRQRRAGRPVPVHRLPLAVRDHRGAARDRGRRRGRARPPQRPAPTKRSREERAGDRVTLALARASRPTYYLILAAMLFTIGAVGLLVRRNMLVMFMCVELMLNAVNLTFVSFAKALNDISGQVIVFFTLVGRRGRGRGRPRDHRGHLPAPSRRDRRRPRPAEGLRALVSARDLLDLHLDRPRAAAVRRGGAAAVRQAHRRAASRAGSPPRWWCSRSSRRS